MPRHIFTHEERVKGGKNRYEWIVQNDPGLLLWLKKIIRSYNAAKKEQPTCKQEKP